MRCVEHAIFSASDQMSCCCSASLQLGRETATQLRMKILFAPHYTLSAAFGRSRDAEGMLISNKTRATSPAACTSRTHGADFGLSRYALDSELRRSVAIHRVHEPDATASAARAFTETLRESRMHTA